MDPEANLKEQLDICQRMKKRTDEFNQDENQWGSGDVMDWQKEQADDGARLAELVEALNEWITRGGFLPPSWRKP